MLRKDPFVTGEYYHVFNRGIDKRIIFKSTLDYRRFLMLLYICNSDDSFRLDQLLNFQHKKFTDIFKIDRGEPLVSIGAYCIMPNHFHLLLKQESENGISKFMKKLGTGYAMYFNIKYDRQGALFGGPFKSVLIKNDDNYLLHLYGYIHLNPLELKFPNWKEQIKKPSLKMSEFLKQYPYSSYADYCIDINRIERNILNIDAFPKYFENSKDIKDFIENYFTE